MSDLNTIPKWLLEPELSGSPFLNKQKRIKRKSFIVKTLGQLSETLRNEFLSDHYSKAPGLLQQLDPRVKVLSFVALMGFAAMMRSLSVLIIMYVFTVLLLFLGKLPVFTFTKRIWVVMPLATAVMVLPAVLNIIVPGEPLLIIYEVKNPISWFGIPLPQMLSVTKQGMISAVTLILRVSISVSLGVILTVTTSWAELMKGLCRIKIPSIFITMLDMAYRYIFVLINISLQMFEARKLRTIGTVSYLSNKKFISDIIGVLFAKSMSYSEAVYDAMVARGYTGQIETISSFKLKRLDILWIFSIMIFILILSYFSIR
ncbi:cobalt ECF transporter T component CbiQ [Petroclostridium sp. X23]|uniref:cobalt ECF transporter T component CbiQ n=1 Tax=Petroclostridium sp. X23 TaxID=3045146 RepID=UPI0024AE461B|nr:cobalt ECF transporter T component CbiQ [Petroclostridium sp. X23]WHH56882.1 cobalt ECF transporter T component CbiQ [Petroclostridium sp. X23]